MPSLNLATDQTRKPWMVRVEVEEEVGGRNWEGRKEFIPVGAGRARFRSPGSKQNLLSFRSHP